MECEVCGEKCKKRAQVLILGGELKLCFECVLRLRTERLYYCDHRQTYQFNRHLGKQKSRPNWSLVETLK